MRRLSSLQYLARLEHRTVGGAYGGAGQYVYQLGKRGHFMFFDSRYRPSTAISFHSLAIGDSFVTLRQLERDGKIRLLAFRTEPDCWESIGGVTLKPDMYVELERVGGASLSLWFEVDMGTENYKQLQVKLETYLRALASNERQAFPGVLWVANHAERARELRGLISRGPEKAKALFHVTTKAELAELLG